MQLFAIIVVIFGALCIAASVVLILRPTATHAALNWFASTVRAHVIEQAARLLLGASLVLTAPAMWQPVLFLVIGWLIIVTSVALLCLPWRGLAARVMRNSRTYRPVVGSMAPQPRGPSSPLVS